jgi:hypothetical protein
VLNRERENQMAYFSLLTDAGRHTTLSTPARDRSEALAIFGRELGLKLTLEGGDAIAPYLLDEWDSNPHWVNPTIPVFVASS